MKFFGRGYTPGLSLSRATGLSMLLNITCAVALHAFVAHPQTVVKVSYGRKVAL